MITLPWMDKIREMIDSMPEKERYTEDEQKFIMDFLAPLILYGESEEQRITKHFQTKEE